MAQEVEQTDIRDISYTEAYANKIIEKSLGEYIRQSEKKQTEKERDSRTMKKMWIGATILSVAMLSAAVLLGASRVEEQKRAHELSRADDYKTGMIEKLSRVDSPISVLSGEYQIPSSQLRYSTPSLYSNPVRSSFQTFMEYGVMLPNGQQTFYSNTIENPPIINANGTFWAMDKVKLGPQNTQEYVFAPISTIDGVKKIESGKPPKSYTFSEQDIVYGKVDYTGEKGNFGQPLLGFKANSGEISPLAKTVFDQTP